MTVKIRCLDEPLLMFKGKGEAFHPQFGLRKFGPRGRSDLDSNENDTPVEIRVGIVGSEQSIQDVKGFLNQLNSLIPANPKRPIFYSFPGLGTKNPLNFSITTNEDWLFEIPSEKISECKEGTVEQRSRTAIQLFVDQFERVGTSIEPPPDVVICAIPDSILNYCKRPGRKLPMIRVADRTENFRDADIFDFHNYLKIIAMKYPFFTQFVKPTTLNLTSTAKTLQEPSERAWNFTMALYYKATNIPWKLAHFSKGTCYVGISFIRIFIEREASVQATMTQVFLKSGDHFVLRGKPFQWDKKKGRSPHLDKKQASEILKQAIDVYKDQKHNLPNRIVIHKSSYFSDEEKEGFELAAKGIPEQDFLSVSSTDLRLIRFGNYPVIRGTLLSTNKEHFLFTTGYTPILRTYPGPRIPRPLRIISDCPDANIVQICSEILALSKMDWNKTAVATRLPVTLEISRRIGSILAEPISQDIKPLQAYRYYM